MIAGLKQITIFILAGQMLLHLLPGGGFEKYVKILFRIMILTQLVIFIFSIGKNNMQKIFEQSMKEYADQMEQFSVESAGLENLEYEYNQMAVLITVQEKLKEMTEKYGMKIEKAILREDGILEIRICEYAVRSDSETEIAALNHLELEDILAQKLDLDAEELEVIWDG